MFLPGSGLLVSNQDFVGLEDSYVRQLVSLSHLYWVLPDTLVVRVVAHRLGADLWVLLLVEHFLLIVHPEDNAHFGDVSEFTQGAVWLFFINPATSLKISSNRVAPDARTSRPHKTIAHAHLNKCIFNKSFSCLDHQIRSKLLSIDPEISKALRVRVQYFLTQRVHWRFIHHVEWCIGSECLSQVTFSHMDVPFGVQVLPFLFVKCAVESNNFLINRSWEPFIHLVPIFESSVFRSLEPWTKPARIFNVQIYRQSSR